MNKPFQDLDLKNSFLFSAALADEETCRLVLEIIMGQKLPRMRVHTEHAILLNSDFRSVRFDIYADDEPSQIQDESVERLHKRVTALKRRRELEASYMTFEELLKDEKDAGLAEGREEGREEGRKAGIELKLMELIRKKLAKGQSAVQIAEDLLEEPSYISELIKKMKEAETNM